MFEGFTVYQTANFVIIHSVTHSLFQRMIFFQIEDKLFDIVT